MLSQKDLVRCFNLYTQNTLSTILYGNEIGSLEESDAKELFDLGQMFLSFIGFEYSVLDIFPILERLPGVSSLLTKKTDGIFEKLLQRYEKSLKLSIQKPTWNITQALHRFRNEDLNWKEFCIETGESELAGAVTLSLSIATMTNLRDSIFEYSDHDKFAAQHPEETQKIQREIDRIVGPDRAPTTEDLENLPFLQAFINECFRLEQPAPFGLPRAAIKDEEYMGYRIPAGAFIFSNQWAIGMEESVFEEPASFRPQRWLDKPELPEPAVFGFGTRGCPGKWVAKSVIHIAMAGIFWGFEFKDNGNAENSNVKARSLFASPDLSDIQCSHRSPAHKATIERQWRETNTNPSSILNEFGTSLGQGNARKTG
ncbi:cytochrome P450 [Penicillium angulare]|uniref:Cytochrome P450 n=1 Tax=Penicillium angulare TaxID=116970 RepID=A0A9W9G815_9EURO|nr:cytochrome P450 [Penicillium angulare]